MVRRDGTAKCLVAAIRNDLPNAVMDRAAKPEPPVDVPEAMASR